MHSSIDPKTERNQSKAGMDDAMSEEEDEDVESLGAKDCSKVSNLPHCSCINFDDTKTKCELSSKCKDNKGIATSFYWDSSKICTTACGKKPSKRAETCCACTWGGK